MSCSEGNSGGLERYPGTGCCGTSCAAGKTGCLASEPRIRSCFCQENVGCLDRSDCGGFRPRGTAATGACPGPCQCAEEEAWNRNVPPKPNCEWLTNFSELRRQWSDHGRQNNCKCCNCKPCRTAAPCKPCLPPVPRCSTAVSFSDSCQDYCNERLSGGACGQSTPRQRDSSPSSAMHSFGGCSPPNYNSTIASNCCSPRPNPCSLPCETPSQSSLSNFSTCRPPSSCQPCSPSPRPILKKRSCCQCITGHCMCQPMPRTCNCPPPVQVDARAERECECECPSSPECACPPSERKFARTKVKCPNARMCCPTPRPQPGPKCCCTKCQPCLPPPCDPCTSSKCRTVAPKVKPCCADSTRDERSSCRSESPKSSPCRPTPPCSHCQKMAPPCRMSSQLGSLRQDLRQIRPLNRPRSPDFRCPATSGSFRSDEGCGDDNGDADTGNREAQCHCGTSDSRGCDELCDYCCSVNCNDDILADVMRDDEGQCDCGEGTRNEDKGCDENCDYCCSLNCDDKTINCFDDKKTSANLDKPNRMAAGGANDSNGSSEDKSCQKKLNSQAWSRSLNNSKKDTSDKSHPISEAFGKTDEGYSSRSVTMNRVNKNSMSALKSKLQRNDDSTFMNPQDKNVSPCNSLFPKVTVLSAVAESPRSPCKLLRSLIRAKSPVKHYK